MQATSKQQASSFGKTVFWLTVLVAIYFIITASMNVYRYAVVGAIAELAWLPMMALLFGLPIAAAYGFWKDRFTLRSLHLYSLLILLVAIGAILLVMPDKV